MGRRKQRVSISSDTPLSELKVTSQQNQIVMTNEQFQLMLQTIQTSRDSVDRSSGSPGSVSPVRSQITIQGNFARCTNRFSGKDTEDVEIFLNAIQIYKSCENITDENALRGLSLLLEGHAALWWKGISSTTDSWNQAVLALQQTFSRKLPAPEVFREIFAREQADSEPTELFICQLRALLSQLPYTLPIEAQIDMVYGLLNRKIKKRLIRSDFHGFDELLFRVRAVELSLRHSSNSQPAFTDNESKVSSSGTKPKIKCKYCNALGHSRHECQKLQKKQMLAKTDDSSHPNGLDPKPVSKKPLVCYGCGAEGVIRSKCQNCSGSKGTSDTVAPVFGTFQIASAVTEKVDRPILDISVNGSPGTAVADSGAQTSIASHTLYKLLQTTGHKFTETHMIFSYADGKARNEKVLQTDVDVHIRHKVVSIRFTVLVNTATQFTLLGMDFLEKAGVVLNLSKKCWSFADDARRVFPFHVAFPTKRPQKPSQPKKSFQSPQQTS